MKNVYSKIFCMWTIIFLHGKLIFCKKHYFVCTENWLFVRKVNYQCGKLIIYAESWLYVRKVDYLCGKLIICAERWLSVWKVNYLCGKLIICAESWLSVHKIDFLCGKFIFLYDKFFQTLLKLNFSYRNWFFVQKKFFIENFPFGNYFLNKKIEKKNFSLKKIHEATFFFGFIKIIFHTKCRPSSERWGQKWPLAKAGQRLHIRYIYRFSLQPWLILKVEQFSEVQSELLSVKIRFSIFF